MILNLREKLLDFSFKKVELKRVSLMSSLFLFTISNWVRQFRDECQINEKANDEYNYMKENLRLRKELEDAKKENEFLKKAAAFFAKEID